MSSPTATSSGDTPVITLLTPSDPVHHDGDTTSLTRSKTGPYGDGSFGSSEAPGSMTGTDGREHDVWDFSDDTEYKSIPGSERVKGPENHYCMRTFAVGLLVVGAVATVLGVLAIMGSALPTTPFFQNIASITHTLGIQLGTDAWTISILTTALGGARLIGGGLWTAGNRWIQRKEENAFREDLKVGYPSLRKTVEVESDWSSSGE